MSPQTRNAPKKDTPTPPITDRQVSELSLLHHISCLLDQSLHLRDVVTPMIEAVSERLDMRYATPDAAEPEYRRYPH